MNSGRAIAEDMLAQAVTASMYGRAIRDLRRTQAVHNECASGKDMMQRGGYGSGGACTAACKAPGRWIPISLREALRLSVPRSNELDSVKPPLKGLPATVDTAHGNRAV